MLVCLDIDWAEDPEQFVAAAAVVAVADRDRETMTLFETL